MYYIVSVCELTEHLFFLSNGTSSTYYYYYWLLVLLLKIQYFQKDFVWFSAFWYVYIGGM